MEPLLLVAERDDPEMLARIAVELGQRDGLAMRQRFSGLPGDEAVSIPCHDRKERHRQRHGQYKSCRLKIRHLPHGAASRFRPIASADPSTQWVCTAHTLICINALSLPRDRMSCVPGTDASSGRLRSRQPVTGAVI
jgi:hypothetical protein